MTVNEACGRLNVTYDFCLRLLRQGLVKGVKVGRVWKVDPRSVRQRVAQVADHRARQR